jgi:MFS family permease
MTVLPMHYAVKSRLALIVISFYYPIGLSRPLLNVYPLDLGATEAQQTTIFSVAMLPCTFKIFFGFISDQFPLWGTRRKGYMWIGWSISTLTMVMLLLTCNLSMDWNNANSIVPDNAPSVQQLSLSFLIFGTGFWMADVMGDSIVAERAKLEPSSSRGQLQSTCYACRFFGMMVAAPISTLLYNSNYGPWSIVLSMAIIPPVIMGPLIYLLEEMPPTRILSANDQFQEIWAAVCSRAVWQPMGFVSSNRVHVFLVGQ